MQERLRKASFTLLLYASQLPVSQLASLDPLHPFYKVNIPHLSLVSSQVKSEQDAAIHGCHQSLFVLLGCHGNTA